MLRLNFAYILVLISVIYSLQVLCQNPDIPDIFDILKKSGNKTVGYKIIWEINDITAYTGNGVANGTSYSVIEYYDIENRRGRLDIAPSHDLNGTFIYDFNTNETFYLTMGKCIRGNVTQRPAFLKILLDDFYTNNFTANIPNQPILGPSSLLRLLYLLKDKTNLQRFVTKMTYNDKRYFNGNLWNSIPPVMGWAFTDPSSPNPYGFKDIAFPIWVGVGNTSSTGNWEASKIYEVAQFIPFTPTNKKLISTPLGLGCGRNPSAITKAPVVPSIRKEVSYDMKLEVVMQPSWVQFGNDSNPSNLVDNGRLTYDDVSNMTAWEYTGFKNVKHFNNNSNWANRPEHSEANNQYINGGYYYSEIIDTGHNSIYDGSFTGKSVLGSATKIVWDHSSSIMYMIDDFHGDCAIAQKKVNDFTVSINFKSGVRIPVNTPYLLQNDGFVYMGEFLERGIPAIVFERKVDNMQIGFGNSSMISTTVVFTHYYMKSNYSTGAVINDMLLKIGVSVLNPYQNGTQVWSASINVNEFTVKVDTVDMWPYIKQKVFNIKSCYLTPGLSKWFQIGIPVTPRQYIILFQQSDAILRNFLTYMYTAPDMHIHPTRIPVTLTGWEQNTLYITALLLERPPFSYDFYPLPTNQRLKDVGEQSLVNNYQQCAGPCLDEAEFCSYFSLCDDFVCLLGPSYLTLTDQPSLIPANNCTTYKKTSVNTKRTLNKLIETIKNKVLNPIQKLEQQILPFNFNVYIINATNELESIPLTAVQFKSGFNFGYYGQMDDLKPAGNDRYDMKPLTHYVIANNDKRFSLVSASGYQQCQQKCDNFGNDTCHSFSFCTKDNECILSTLYTAQLNAASNNQTYAQKSDCAILYREYFNDFTRYGERLALTQPKFCSKQYKVVNEEECAQKCYNETSFKCRSFDNCYDYQTPLNFNCFLHTTHYLDTAQPLRESTQLSFKNTTSCGHYSRNYASDYNVRNGVKYADNTNKLRITVTGVSVEQCAHDCSESQSLRQCLGFTFCSSSDPTKAFQSTSCVLSPTNDQNNLILYTNDTQCSIYFRDQIGFTLKLYTSSAQPVIYSSGAGAGIGIIMIILGACIVVAAIFLYNKRKSAQTV